MASENNGGEWQAQGGDCPKPKGHRLKWSQSDAPTKADGIEMLGQLADICTRRQRALREAACADAKAYVEAAPSEGYPGFHMQSFYVKDPPKKAKGGRIDLEVITGMAFCDEP